MNNTSPAAAAPPQPLRDTAPVTERPAGRFNVRDFWDQAGMFLVALLLFAGCALFVPNFFTVFNFRGLALSISLNGMIACTMLFCLASGNVDLSVGSIVAFAGVATAVVIKVTGSIALGIAAGVLGSGLVGLVNGWLVAVLGFNALISTLATMQIVRGAGYIVSSGNSVGVADPRFYLLGNTAFLSIPVPVWVLFACFALFGFILERTTLGRNTLAIGGNEEAARLAGVAIAPLKIWIFTVQGLVAGFAGVILSSRMTSGQPMTSQGLELEVISACVLGGVSLSGGVGRMLYVVSGVLILGTVTNALNLLNVPPFYQYVARGVILLAAVFLDQLKRRGGR